MLLIVIKKKMARKITKIAKITQNHKKIIVDFKRKKS